MIAALTPWAKITDHPTLVLIRGMPGSGKSYLATALRKSLQQKTGQDGVVLLDPDATDYQSKAYIEHTEALTVEGVDPKLHAYRFLRAKAYKAIEDHKIIIWNQAFTNLEIFNKMIDRLRDHAALHHTELPILVVEVEIDLATARARTAARERAGGHGISDNAFERFIGDYKSFAGEGFNTVTVQGDADIAESVMSVLKALQEL
jgi:deoxyadenosine/deoxycytidine kinase